MTEGCKEFGRLKALYLAESDQAKKEDYFNRMKNNLLERNSNNSDVELYSPEGGHIDIWETTDYKDLFSADMSLNIQGL